MKKLVTFLGGQLLRSSRRRIIDVQILTEPGQERIAQPANTGDVEIETITITLGDGTVLLITRDTHSYRMSVIKRGGEEVASRVLPQSTLTVGRVLERLRLEAQTRATLFTLLTLRSFVSPG